MCTALYSLHSILAAMMSPEILRASLGADINPTEIMRAASLAFLSAISLLRVYPNVPKC